VGRGKDEDSVRSHLCTAVAKCLTWVDMRHMFSVNMPVIQEVDRIIGLPLFRLVVVGPTSDTELVYRLLREYPPEIVGLINDSHPNTSTGTA